MKNFRSAFCMVLCCVILLGMTVVTAYAANFTDTDKIVNTEAVETLVKLNVMNGKDDGTFDPTGLVTRAEMCKMISRIMNSGDDFQEGVMGKNFSYSYTDIIGHWAKDYIAHCDELGIVSGPGDGTFSPDGNVAGVEAAKMLLVAIGYDATIEGFTGSTWADAVTDYANQKNLFYGLNSFDASTALTRDTAAQMIYNSLSAVMVTYEYKITSVDGVLQSEAIVMDKANGDTLLSEKFNITK